MVEKATLSKLLGHTFVRDSTRVWDPGEEKYIKSVIIPLISVRVKVVPPSRGMVLWLGDSAGMLGTHQPTLFI